MFGERLRKARKSKDLTLEQLANMYNLKYHGGLSKGTLSKYENNNQEPMITTVANLANILDVSVDYLIDDDVNNDIPYQYEKSLNFPDITEDYVTFPVLGEIAAGYDHIAMEDWDCDTVDIPESYLRGHSSSDFFVLRVKGDSMYPLYHDGDKVLILKQSDINASGDIGVIIYDDEYATLKKIEYEQGKNRLRLVPINPNIPPVLIEGEDIEHCRILGIPKLLIREID